VSTAPATEHLTTRQVLLEGAMDFIRERGPTGWSLRELAASCGTTHSHLQYHFKTRELLLVDVMLEVRRRFNLDFKPGTAGTSLADEVLDDFVELAATRRDEFRGWFYVAGLALQDPSLDHFLTGIVSGWVEVAGASQRERARRRVALATMRGLLLDLLATEDTEGVQLAVEELADMLRKTERARR
jgi:AcrR family transcriptional regulator